MQSLQRKAAEFLLRSGKCFPGQCSTPLALPFLTSMLHSSSQQCSDALSATPGSGLIEIREYTLQPEGFNSFMAVTKEYAHLRQEMMPFLGMFHPETGGALNRVIHFYHWSDFNERDKRRKDAARNKWWLSYLQESRAFITGWESSFYVEDVPVYKALGHPGTANYVSPSAQPISNAGASEPAYEFRVTQLAPGYGSVPKLVSAFAAGLPPKVKADPSGQLVFFGHTEFGTLNKVVELWRYPSAQACVKARQLSRSVPEWKETIAAITPGVQSFTSTLLRPAAFSPWH